MAEALNGQRRNASWSVDKLRGQYSNGSSSSDLYQFLSQWVPVDAFLNIGYSRFGQWHLGGASQRRLVDKILGQLMSLHDAGPYSNERRMVDVGSGRGGPAVRAAKARGLEVIGVDLTPYNVAAANAYARSQLCADRVRFVTGSASELPIADASVPLVWSIESPAHFPDKAAFVREASRLLKQGGSFALADLLVVAGTVEKSAENQQIYDEFLQVWDVPFLETRSSYLKLLDAAGFRVVREETITAHNLDILSHHCRLFMALCDFTPFSAFYEPFLERTTGANLNNVYRHVRTSFEALSRGMIDYGLYYAIKT